MLVNGIILQGRVQVPTGGIAREPRGMIRWNSGADSIVWMKEERGRFPFVRAVRRDGRQTALWDGMPFQSFFVSVTQSQQEKVSLREPARPVECSPHGRVFCAPMGILMQYRTNRARLFQTKGGRNHDRTGFYAPGH